MIPKTNTKLPNVSTIGSICFSLYRNLGIYAILYGINLHPLLKLMAELVIYKFYVELEKFRHQLF